MANDQSARSSRGSGRRGGGSSRSGGSRSSSSSSSSARSQPARPATPAKRWYRAIAGMGSGDDRVAAMEEFEAYPDDPRVKSGFAVPLPDKTPPAVAAAFDAAEGSADGVGGAAG